MAVALPLTPAPRQMNWRLVSRRRDLEPAFGGPVTRVRRLGSRWSVDVEMPPLPYKAALAWVAALTSAEGDTVTLRIPQPGLDVGAPGSPLVNGGGQLGSSLAIDGVTPAYIATAGQWLNLTANGRKYLYQIASGAVATAGAIAALAISPMIRRSPADNSAVEIVAPVIEGFLSGRETGWTVEAALTVGLSFTITERE